MTRDTVRSAISLTAFGWCLAIGATGLLGVAAIASGEDVGRGLLMVFGAALLVPPGVVVIGLCRMFCDIHEHFAPGTPAPPPLRPLTPRASHLRKLGKAIDE